MSGTRPGKRKPRLRALDRRAAQAHSRRRVDAVASRALSRASGGLASCQGQRLSNEQSSDVGTGKAFQVPSLLGVAQRTPLMHDGCAATLEARFTDTACGGGDKHGVTSHLFADEIADLVAYLETL